MTIYLTFEFIFLSHSVSDKFDTIRILVEVLDVKEAPEWQMLLFPYRGVVPTDAPNGARIYQLTANDPDQEGDHEVRYHLRSGKISHYISINRFWNVLIC